MGCAWSHGPRSQCDFTAGCGWPFRHGDMERPAGRLGVAGCRASLVEDTHSGATMWPVSLPGALGCRGGEPRARGEGHQLA